MALSQFDNQAPVLNQIGGSQTVRGSIFNGPVNIADPGAFQRLTSESDGGDAVAYDNEILRLLAFPQMLDRRNMIEPAHDNTCQWILDLEEFKTWNFSSHSLLWLKGKPGAGKSTIMSFLYNNLRRAQSQHDILLDFFFNARGHELQRTPIGMFRSLLNQLFQLDHEARQPLRAIYKEKRSRFGGDLSTSCELQRHELGPLLTETLIISARKRQVTVLIDALDEMGESAAHYFHQMNDQVQSFSVSAKICISSRHYPIPSTVPGVEVSVELHNTSDIAMFVRDRLSLDDRTPADTPDLEQWHLLKAELVERAQGVFQWIRLVVDILEQYLDAGDSLEDAREQIKQVPEQLEAIYEHVIRNTINPRHRIQSFALFQWVCLARRPLSLIELRYALSAKDDGSSSHLSRFEERHGFITTDKLMERRLRALSGGLVEVVDKLPRGRGGDLGNGAYGIDDGYFNLTDITQPMQIVQVVHQSVNDFLLKDGLMMLASMRKPYRGTDVLSDAGIPQPDLICDGHAMIYWSCLRYLSTEDPRTSDVEPKHTDTKRMLRSRMRRDQSRYPLLLYAIDNLFEHAKQARGSRGNETAQQAELIELILARWDDFLHFEPSFTSLHLAAITDLADLIEHFINNGACVDARSANLRTPLHFAVHNGHEAAAKKLVLFGADINAETSFMRYAVQTGLTPLALAAAGGHVLLVKWLLDFPGSIGENGCKLGAPLCLAAENGHDKVVQFLIDAGANPNAVSGDYATSLQAAAHMGHPHVVRLLLNSGANANLLGGRYGSAMIAACSVANFQIIQSLLDAGAYINALTEAEEGYALQLAVIKGHLLMVETLLARGADVNQRGGRHVHALHAACAIGELDIVQCLLKAGANINARGWRSQTPIQIASFSTKDGSETLVKCLLDNGADVNAAGGQYGTALQGAAVRCCGKPFGPRPTETVCVLLDAGADIDIRNSNDCTILQFAVALRDMKMTKLLLQHGATDHDGQAADFLAEPRNKGGCWTDNDSITHGDPRPINPYALAFEKFPSHPFGTSSIKFGTTHFFATKVDDTNICSHCWGEVRRTQWIWTLEASHQESCETHKTIIR